MGGRAVGRGGLSVTDSNNTGQQNVHSLPISALSWWVVVLPLSWVPFVY